MDTTLDESELRALIRFALSGAERAFDSGRPYTAIAYLGDALTHANALIERRQRERTENAE